MFGNMTYGIVAQEVRRSHKAFRMIENPAWIEQGTCVQEISIVPAFDGPILVVLIDVLLLIPVRESGFQHAEI